MEFLSNFICYWYSFLQHYSLKFASKTIGTCKPLLSYFLDAGFQHSSYWYVSESLSARAFQSFIPVPQYHPSPLRTTTDLEEAISSTPRESYTSNVQFSKHLFEGNEYHHNYVTRPLSG